MNHYPTYKSSGVDWIGEIPEHWSKMRLRYISTNFDGKRVPLSAEERGALDGDIPYYGATGVIDQVRDYLFDGDYMLVGEDGAPFFIPNKDVAFIARGKFWVNNHAHILKVSNVADISYTTHVLNTVDYREYISGSTRDKLTQDELSAIVLPFPTLHEQHAIARYLDDKTKKIDTLIEMKQRLVELLKEQRTAIINQAVTKGINSNVKMKESGIEWLGEIPEHWEKNKLVRIAEIKGRIGWKGYTVSDLRDEGDGVLALGATQIDKTNRINLSNPTYISFEKYEESPEIKLVGGELLMVKVGATIGKIALVPKDLGDATINPNVMIVRNSGLDKRFLYYYFHSVAVSISLELAKSAGAQDAINQEFVGSLMIPIPPRTEQIQISDFLDMRTSKIDDSIGKAEGAIEFLQEYRTALISEVVTGKIDVREWSEYKEAEEEPLLMAAEVKAGYDAKRQQ